VLVNSEGSYTFWLAPVRLMGNEHSGQTRGKPARRKSINKRSSAGSKTRRFDSDSEDEDGEDFGENLSNFLDEVKMTINVGGLLFAQFHSLCFFRMQVQESP